MSGIETTTISSKGQITIPLRIRKTFKIIAGQQFTFSEHKNGILLKPVDVTITDKTQTNEWSVSLQQALADVKAGRVKRFMSSEKFFAYLDELAAEGKPKPARPRAKRAKKA
jgi:AbrB family looped-hinge helix DNA binding protein